MNFVPSQHESSEGFRDWIRRDVVALARPDDQITEINEDFNIWAAVNLKGACLKYSKVFQNRVLLTVTMPQFSVNFESSPTISTANHYSGKRLDYTFIHAEDQNGTRISLHSAFHSRHSHSAFHSCRRLRKHEDINGR